MPRIHPLSPAQATGAVAEHFDVVRGKLGMVPNLMRTLGHSPAALDAYLQFSGRLASGSLSSQQRERIALAVAEANQCDYCLAAHAALGKMAGLSADQIRDARQGSAVDSQSDALLRFVVTLVQQRGRVSSAGLQELRDHGFNDAEITEVVANVALNLFTNYFNHVAETDLDFPRAERLSSAAA